MDDRSLHGRGMFSENEDVLLPTPPTRHQVQTHEMSLSTKLIRRKQLWVPAEGGQDETESASISQQCSDWQRSSGAASATRLSAGRWHSNGDAHHLVADRSVGRTDAKPEQRIGRECGPSRHGAATPSGDWKRERHVTHTG